MGRLAAAEFGADWVIHSDADEFWWPRGDSLKDVLASIPTRYGIVRRLLRHFVPRPEDEASFAERMTVRISSSAPINDPRSLFRPNLKIIHRADPNVNVSIGAQRLIDSPLVPLRGWYPIEFFHFPVRSLEQCERKYAHQQTGPGQTPSPYYDRVRALIERGGSRSSTSRWSSTMTRSSVVSRRARSSSTPACATRCARCGEGQRITFPRPTVVDEAAYAVDVAALGEADVVRLQRRLDTLEQRLLTVERRPSVRIERTAARRREEAAPPQLRSAHEARPHRARPRRGRRHRRPDRLSPQRGRRLRHRDGQQLPRRNDGDPRGVRAGRRRST